MEASGGPTAAPRSRRPCQTTRTLMHLRSALAALAALTLACSGKKADGPGEPAGKASSAPPVAADATIRDASAAVVPAPATSDSLLAARAAVTDWIAARRRTPNALDVFLDQYGGDEGRVKVLFVGFSSTDTNAGATQAKERECGGSHQHCQNVRAPSVSPRKVCDRHEKRHLQAEPTASWCDPSVHGARIGAIRQKLNTREQSGRNKAGYKTQKSDDRSGRSRHVCTKKRSRFS